MKFTALVAAVSLALSGALLAGCNRDSGSASGGGTSASRSSGASGSSDTSGQTSSGGVSGQQSEGSTTPGAAPKRPASPSGSTSGSSSGSK